MTLNKDFINGTVPYEVTGREKKYICHFDVAPVLAKKHRNGTSIPSIVPLHVDVVVSDELQSVINQNVIAYTEHNQL